MRNPFRSEADAFRLLVIIGAAAAVVIAATVALGPGAGAVLAAILLIAGLWSAFRWVREGIAPATEPDPREPGEPDSADRT
jgi:hypothetical protein